MSAPLTEWPHRIEEVLATCRVFRSVRVLAETGSTQGVARELSDDDGSVVVAWRQTTGRGRLGRAWCDTADQGVAVTFVAPDDRGERLAAASAVAAARAIESSAHLKVGIKWPNDIVVDGRKLAGILIERVGGRALIGIGVNVAQAGFPSEISHLATSVRLLGRDVDRLVVLLHLVRALDAALQLDDATLASEYAFRDALRGSVATFGTPEGEITGRVLWASPFEGLAIATAEGETRLSAATTTVLAWRHEDGVAVEKRDRSR